MNKKITANAEKIKLPRLLPVQLIFFNAKAQRRGDANKTANYPNFAKFFSLSSPNEERAGVRSRHCDRICTQY